MTFECISSRQTPEETWRIEAAPTITLEDEINHFFERQMPLDIREERLGQRMLEAPQEGVHWLVAFEGSLYRTKQFSIMLDRDPQRAHRLIARHVRKVPFSALSALVFNQVLENVVPLLESNTPLCPNSDARPYYLKHKLPYQSERPFEGNAAAFSALHVWHASRWVGGHISSRH